MRGLSGKLFVCACVWRELMAEFGLGAESASILALLLMFLSTAVLQVIRLAMHLAGPGVTSIALQGFVLFWRMAPQPCWTCRSRVACGEA